MSKIVPVAKAQIPQNPDQQVKMNENTVVKVAADDAVAFF